MIIEGVEIKQLATHPDERGFFREVIRVTDTFFGEGFGQLSHSLMYHGVVKAWHIHPRQIDWWYVPIGALKVALHDLREDSPTRGVTSELLLGEMYNAQVLKIPAGVAHGCVALVGPTHLLYVTSRVYDPQEEGRIPHDDEDIGYDWLAGPPIR
ncbi:MAG TPA: dTDP-4-dehydrorhamnose 3,5-epimerase family protein [Chloroflexota bacterium]|nr:dTDP-4-dehydrorhamnose 3,5-epimerase family protein [Chloroflexota bacterium]